MRPALPVTTPNSIPGASHAPARVVGRMGRLLLASLIVLLPLPASAQAAGAPPTAPTRVEDADEAADGLATPAGHDVSVFLGSYTYREPGTTSISIHGPKLGAEYTGTLSLGARGHWFARGDARGIAGHVTYDGWCSPFQITPNSASPNGYELGIGDPSPCSESGDSDWYLDARGVIGKDLVGDTWALSPFGGVGLRHLSNGATGTPGFRTDNYLYVPLGATARVRVASHRTLSVTVEYDRLVRGWQTTRDSALGGGDVPATPTAPPFTIDGFSDISFAQHRGWAVRASAKYQVGRRWWVEPTYLHWAVGDSPVSYETATFTVNGVTAREQWGAYEPTNTTDEFGVKIGLHF